MSMWKKNRNISNCGKKESKKKNTKHCSNKNNRNHKVFGVFQTRVVGTWSGRHTGCFINSVTILILYMIKISILNSLTSKYYKNIMICILFGIKIDPYFRNLGLLYEILKKAHFLCCVQIDVTVRVFKTEGSNNPNWASSGPHCIWFSLHIKTSLCKY